MRYTWPDLGYQSLDFFGLRHDHTTFRDLHFPEGLFDEMFSARAAYLRVLEGLGLLVDATRWVPIGPSAMLNGQATGNPIVAGRVRDLKVHPDGQRAYAGSANGGVWYTEDGGNSWLPLGSWGIDPSASSGIGGRVQSLTIGSLDVHFGQNGDGTDNPDLDVVYAATGELRPQDQASPGTKHGGIGVLRLDGAVNQAVANPGNVPWLREGTALSGAGIYRLTHDPAADLAFATTGSNTLVAAASTGLYFRDGPFVPDAPWTRVTRAPFNFDADAATYCADVLWTSGAPSRLFVALTDAGGSDTAVYVTTSGPDSDYTRINLNGARQSGRLRLAAAPSDQNVVYVLGTGAGKRARLWRIEGVGPARVVDRMPPGLFGTPTAATDGTITVTGDQSYYDMALGVDPANADIVYAGGSTIQTAGGHNANMHKLTINGTDAADDFATDFSAANNLQAQNDPTYFGDRAHSDVHAIQPLAADVWIGCDGGVFVRTATGMQARNYGLAVSEPGFVASHPSEAGALIAGTQDNGRIERIGDTIWRLWRKGDGGGSTYHQTKPAHYLAQYTRAHWVVNGGSFTNPVFRTVVAAGANPPQSETDESTASSFYSGVAATTGNGDDTRIAIGTNRIWFSPDWNPTSGTANSWVTLPTGSSDPRDPTALNDGQDKLESGEQVLSLKWARRGDETNGFDGARLLALTTQNILQFSYSAAEDTWSRQNFTDEKSKNRITDNDNVAPGPTDRLPHIGIWTEIAPHDPARGAHGSFYVGATGKARLTATGEIDEADRMDTLWWFDGDGNWHPTNLRNQGLDAAAGTSGSKAPVFAVIVDPDHPETVFVGNSSGVWKGTFSLSGSTPTWRWTGLLNGLPQAVVQDLSVFTFGTVRLLRAALQSRGVWQLDISDTPASVGNTYLRVTNLDSRQTEVAADPIDPRSQANPPTRLGLTNSPDIHVHTSAASPPWGTGNLPNEAEMYDRTEIATALTTAGIRHRPGVFPTYVMVHHRHTVRLAGNAVSVLLLRLDNAPDDLTTVPIDADWRQRVLDLIGGSSTTPPSGWALADPGTPVRTLSLPVEARTPRAVEFSADLSHAVPAPPGLDNVLLLGVVSSDRDSLTMAKLNSNNLAILIRRKRHVAARLLLRRP